MPRFNEDLIKSASQGTFIKDVRFLEETESTNKSALTMAYHGAPEGTAVIADAQTAGRGRLGRLWISPPGKNIYVSLILRPAIDPSSASQITLVAGVAVAEMLNTYCPGRIELKWPNDVLANGRKLCGILAESRVTAEKVEYVVVGIGINVNMEPGHFDESIREIATSIRMEAGAEIPREEVVARLFWSLDRIYRLYLETGFGAIREKWLDCSGMIGKDITVSSPDGLVKGTVVGMGAEGQLTYLHEGKIKSLTAGEITIQPGAGE